MCVCACVCVWCVHVCVAVRREEVKFMLLEQKIHRLIRMKLTTEEKLFTEDVSSASPKGVAAVIEYSHVNIR